MNYKRVTIDIEEADKAMTTWADENTDTYTSGVWGVDGVGVYHMYYGSRNDLVTFYDPMELP